MSGAARLAGGDHQIPRREVEEVPPRVVRIHDQRARAARLPEIRPGERGGGAREDDDARKRVIIAMAHLAGSVPSDCSSCARPTSTRSPSLAIQRVPR